MISDENLMMQYSQGHASAFATLYARHEMPVWRFVMRSVQSASTADDVMQDVWFAVAQNAKSYQPTAKFSTWLFTLAHNRLVDYVRRSSRQQKNHVNIDDSTGADGQAVFSPALQLFADSQFGPVRQVQSAELAQALISAVEALPPEQREAFLLQAEGDMSVEDIATALGVSFETAKSRLRYARGKLKKSLEAYV
jgi:RNA polymerase sigma factor (sigma-70 family)